MTHFLLNRKSSKLNQLANDFFKIFGLEESNFESSLCSCNSRNSAYTNVIIKTKGKEHFNIQMINAQGNELFSKSTDLNHEGKVIAIPVNNIQEGNYFIRVSNDKRMVELPFQK